jgi:hypothetical protein
VGEQGGKRDRILLKAGFSRELRRKGTGTFVALAGKGVQQAEFFLTDQSW